MNNELQELWRYHCDLLEKITDKELKQKLLRHVIIILTKYINKE